MLDRRLGARGPRHREFRVRRARGLRDAAPAPAGRAADVHGVLVRLVRPLGRRACRARSRWTRRRRCGRSWSAGPRSTSTWRTAARTSRAGRAPTGAAATLHDGALEPDVTSYDYDAPIDEYGRPTEKFWRFREVLAAYADGPLPELPPAPARVGLPATVDLDGLGAPGRRARRAGRAREPSTRCRRPSRNWTSTGGWSATRSTSGAAAAVSPDRARAAGSGGGVRRRGAGRSAHRGRAAAQGAGRRARARGAVGGVAGAGQLRPAHRGDEGHHRRRTARAAVSARGAGAGAAPGRVRRPVVGPVPFRALPDAGSPGLYRGTVTVRGAGDAVSNSPAGQGDSCGSTASTWAGTGPSARNGPCTSPDRSCGRASTRCGCWSSRRRPGPGLAGRGRRGTTVCAECRAGMTELFSTSGRCVVKNEDGLHDVGDPVGAAAEFPRQAPAFEGGRVLLTEAADLGVGGVVAPLPSLGATASDRDADGVAGLLVRLVGPAAEARVGESTNGVATKAGCCSSTPRCRTPGCGALCGRRSGRGPLLRSPERRSPPPRCSDRH